MIKVVNYPSEEAENFIKKLAERSSGVGRDLEREVYEIIDRVRLEGDKALLEYTRKFDFPEAVEETLKASEEELEKAYKKVDRFFLDTIDKAYRNIRAFHEKQMEKSWFINGEGGILLGQMVSPVSSAGIYVPGGRGGDTPLISSLLMGAIPAIIAGVSDIAVVTPPKTDGTISEKILAAAKFLGIKRVYKIGSAWAVAALAFGTETVSKVDVIVGPGNIYVATAKKLVSGFVGIDLLAGPSEVLIIADESASPAYVASDLLSQAEHDPLSSALLITTSEELARKVVISLRDQLEGAGPYEALPRREIASASLGNYGCCFLVKDVMKGIELANRVAPEHLELQLKNPWDVLGLVRNAGAVFMGHFTPEALGDYLAGPNHVLPTAGTARFASALGVHAFLKKTSVIYYPVNTVEKHVDAVACFARWENLEAHARSVEIRKNFIKSGS